MGERSALWLTDLVLVDANRGAQTFSKTVQPVPDLSLIPSESNAGPVIQGRRLLAEQRGLLNTPIGPEQVAVDEPTRLDLSGGALKVDIEANSYVQRVLFYANEAHNGGAAAFEQDSVGTFTNCTFLYNDASVLGGMHALHVFAASTAAGIASLPASTAPSSIHLLTVVAPDACIILREVTASAAQHLRACTHRPCPTATPSQSSVHTRVLCRAGLSLTCPHPHPHPHLPTPP